MTATAAPLLSTALAVQLALVAAAPPLLLQLMLPLTVVPGPAMVGAMLTAAVMLGPAVTLIVALAWSQAAGVCAGL
ncbi:MAG TPA: hypothetical protein PKC59_00170, partial [Burkholderiaceae bacterium]|nr:hypothetical protein [Burkholderiaceae bacterium]HMY98918.1 hypothetical protein [Burkholderiaceae bacterium]